MTDSYLMPSFQGTANVDINLILLETTVHGLNFLLLIVWLSLFISLFKLAWWVQKKTCIIYNGTERIIDYACVFTN